MVTTGENPGCNPLAPAAVGPHRATSQAPFVPSASNVPIGPTAMTDQMSPGARRVAIRAYEREQYAIANPGPRGRFIVSVDVGQRQDHTAVTLARSIDQQVQILAAERFPLMVTYGKQAARIARIIADLLDREPGADVILLVDRGAAGPALLERIDDLAKSKNVPANVAAVLRSRCAVVIVTGDKAGNPRSAECSIPKDMLLTTVEILADRGALAVGPRVDPNLLTELLALEITGEDSRGRIRFAAPGSSHDDLALSCLMAAWAAWVAWNPKNISTVTSASGSSRRITRGGYDPYAKAETPQQRAVRTGQAAWVDNNTGETTGPKIDRKPAVPQQGNASVWTPPTGAATTADAIAQYRQRQGW